MIYEKVTVEKVIMNLFSRPVMESLFRRQKIYQGTSSRFRSGKEFPGFKVPRSETWPGKAHRTVQKVDLPNDEITSSTNFNGSISARRIETLPGFATEPVFASLANLLGRHENLPNPVPSQIQDYKMFDVEIKYGLVQVTSYCHPLNSMKEYESKLPYYLG